MMRARRFWALLLVACWPLPGIAALAPTDTLDPTDTVQVYGTLSVLHDDNLFRLPDVNSRIFGIDPSDNTDMAFVKSLGLKLNKELSRQRLIADINLSETDYKKNDNLDYTGHNGRVAWLWQVGNYWSGEASYQNRRSLAGFGDFRQNVQDLVDTETYFLSGGYQFHPRWRISAEASETDSSHSAEARRRTDYDASMIGAELRYVTPAQNFLALQARRTDRNYPNRIVGPLSTSDSGHREARVTALGGWQATGKVRLDGRLGYVKVEQDTLSQRDFSDHTWRAAAVWDATGKLRLTANAYKDVRLYEDIATSYIVAHGAGLSPVYALTSKLSLQGTFTYEKRDFRGDPGFAVITENREDKVRLARIALAYSPLRYVDFSLSYEIGRRRSNVQSVALIDGRPTRIDINDYDYETWFATLRVGF